jgi:hypothetical protein
MAFVALKKDTGRHRTGNKKILDRGINCNCMESTTKKFCQKGRWY